MPEQPRLGKAPDPLQGLRQAVDAHKAAVDASKRAGEQLQAERQAEPTPQPEPPT